MIVRETDRRVRRAAPSYATKRMTRRRKGVHQGGDGAVVRPGTWMLPDRVGFPEWVNDTFRYPHYRGGDRENTLFLQQTFVRDYMQPASPYAGVILYHGVGTGKSRAAIAAALLLAGGHGGGSSYRVSVLLPSFIKKNFMREIREYPGHPLSEKQKWRKAGGNVGSTWIGGDGDGKTLAELSAEQREAVRAQLNRDIERSVRFVVYNGLTKGNTEALVNEVPNPFERAVTVVDEAHNFNAAVASGGLASVLYERMMAAQDRKVILLTGTPFRNGPVEMPYLVNLAHGYVRTVVMDINRGREAEVTRRVESSPYVNRAVVDHVSAADTDDVLGAPPRRARDRSHLFTLHVQILPFGFVKRGGEEDPTGCMVTDVASAGVEALDEDGVHAHLRDIIKDVVGLSRVRHRLLLPVNDDFLRAFTKGGEDGEGEEEEEQQQATGTIRRVDALTRRVVGTVSYFNAYDTETYPEVIDPPFRVVECPMSAHQFQAYSKLRDVERKSERNSRIMGRMSAPGSGSAEADKSVHTYRSFTRQICIFAFPQSMSRVYRKDIRDSLSLLEEKQSEESRDDDGNSSPSFASKKKTLAVSRAYEAAKEESLIKLRTQFPDALELSATPDAASGTTKNRGRRAGEGDEDGLAVHSPKMQAMLRRFSEVQYPMLVYSQFRRMEGLAILGACLMVNGYERVEIYRDEESRRMRLRVTSHNENNNAKKKRDPPPRFFVYDNADKEAADVGLRLFNSELDGLPGSVREDVKRMLEDPFPGHAATNDENLHGRLVKLLLVTEAGSEGLSLKNVREVHLLEPYWNESRGDQVTGRAVRAHSHDRLPPSERNVRVFMYVAVFTPEQAAEPTIQNLDDGITSDQYLLRIAQTKGVVIRTMHTVLQRAAADCMLHREAHVRSAAASKREGFRHDCLTYTPPERGGPPRCAFAYSLDDTDDRDSEGGLLVGQQQQRRNVVQMVAVKKRGTVYFKDKNTGKLYDYREAKENGRLVPATERP